MRFYNRVVHFMQNDKTYLNDIVTEKHAIPSSSNIIQSFYTTRVEFIDKRGYLLRTHEEIIEKFQKKLKRHYNNE